MKTKRSHNLYYDKWLIVTASILLFLGMLMVSSASMVIADQRFSLPLYYLLRQLTFIIIGVLLAQLVLRIPMRVWERYSGYLLIIGLLLLAAVLIPSIGHVVNGSRRWLHLGILNLQVAEFVKVFAIIYLANYVVRFKEEIQKNFFGSLSILVLLLVMALLLLLEPDFGTFVVISFTFLTVLFLSGMRLLPFLLLLLIAVVLFSSLAILSPYRMARITTFLHPWADQYGSGYQLTQSLIAFGRGGILGVGLGNSVQKLFYLPEAYTDFLFAVIGEELGLLGELVIISLYACLVVRIFIIAKGAMTQGKEFAAYLAYGIGVWLSFQTVVNLGVNLGLLPTKGLTLPLMSYGGSSIMVTCIALGLVLRIAHESLLKEALYCNYKLQSRT